MGVMKKEEETPAKGLEGPKVIEDVILVSFEEEKEEELEKTSS